MRCPENEKRPALFGQVCVFECPNEAEDVALKLTESGERGVPVPHVKHHKGWVGSIFLGDVLGRVMAPTGRVDRSIGERVPLEPVNGDVIPRNLVVEAYPVYERRDFAKVLASANPAAVYATTGIAVSVEYLSSHTCG